MVFGPFWECAKIWGTVFSELLAPTDEGRVSLARFWVGLSRILETKNVSRQKIWIWRQNVIWLRRSITRARVKGGGHFRSPVQAPSTVGGVLGSPSMEGVISGVLCRLRRRSEDQCPPYRAPVLGFCGDCVKSCPSINYIHYMSDAKNEPRPLKNEPRGKVSKHPVRTVPIRSMYCTFIIFQRLSKSVLLLLTFRFRWIFYPYWRRCSVIAQLYYHMIIILRWNKI